MITVFTPTYNRANTLEKLYHSLLYQTYKNFEWVIVDDGSQDNTEEIINKWCNENKITINYHRQLNGGKHRAINKGLDLAKGELFFMVDSDDYLTKDSLETINTYNNTYSNENIIGFAFRRKYSDDVVIGNNFPQKAFISNHIKKTYFLNVKGDLAEVIKTDVFRKFKFPNFENEKFCAEGLVWNRLSNEHRILFVDEAIYVCEYQYDGLSFNSIRNRRLSSNYTLLFYSELEKQKLPFKIKIRTLINFWRFAFFNNKQFFDKLNMLDNKLLALLVLPIGFILKIKDDYNDNVKINNR
ncbi:glycosyltransferase family 2 protein [Empedobacter stercoris]|uniref:glycosyltransferase family 2 protein n=1 Tax=Empedobacter stercoris TaxID=1628248 RepID=UPI001CE1348A|nr:glycosyltransferase family 2 protein [Empedobacter stercoris]MCA4782187.1 glycosyltransferase family 2 protein [Empedobacter stercoris]